MILIVIMLLFIGAVDVFVLSLFVRSWQKHNQDFRILADEIIAGKVKEEIQLFSYSEDIVKRLDDMEKSMDFLEKRFSLMLFGGRYKDFGGIDLEKMFDGFNSNNDDVDNDLYPED